MELPSRVMSGLAADCGLALVLLSTTAPVLAHHGFAVDIAGREHSDQLHLVERFQKVDSNTIKWNVAFEDPKFFTQPWSVTLPIKRQNTELLMYSCEENEKDRGHLQHSAPNDK